jgi:hypothetical protein
MKMAINDFALFVGQLFLGVGGICLALALVGMIGWAAGMAWIMFSDTFRDICKAESMIFEYRKNRTEFMAWKGLKDLEDGK